MTLSEKDGDLPTLVKQCLLQPVLLQLAPHIQQVLADPASRTAESGRVCSFMESCWAKLLLLLAQGEDDYLAALFATIFSSGSSTSGRSSGSGSSSSSNAGPLLSSFEAVAGRIPLKAACNNPGCVSLAQRSELLLVRGKSCVCSRYKAARCCCKACQVEHWKLHKALCKSKAKPAAAEAQQ
ncbi:hypothetical protein OEZ85_013011 [Tetradesmus obliquus]|uniref:MYND-type domain-containing protein n=1 Tax=Tetradesmus obliquus TaxID=3088 RepID=A0ABY8U4E3_TETOB|nr:hypothetical protein OEZ85_013011 [Tetradesmus obliquus]